ERLTSIVKKDNYDNSTNDPLLEEVDLFLASHNLIPQGIENFDYDSEGDIHFLEELLSDDSIPLPKNKSSDSDHQDDPSFPRPPPEPPDVEVIFDLESDLISTMKNNIDELNGDKCFDLGSEIDVLANVEDDDYFPFIFVIRNFLPYLIYLEVFSLLLSAESEDTIFNPDVVLREKLLSINRLIAIIESLNDNPTPDYVLKSSFLIPIFEESDNSLFNNSLPKFETFSDQTEETRSDSTTTHANN
nr:hypothetical protein [Tanacetum cinerariifolium]